MAYLREQEVDIIHVWYSNHVPCFHDACKISFGSVQFKQFWQYFLMCLLQCLRKEWVDFVYIWYSYQS